MLTISSPFVITVAYILRNLLNMIIVKVNTWLIQQIYSSYNKSTMADDWYNAHLNSDFLRDQQIKQKLLWIWQVLKPKFYSFHLNYGIYMHIHYYNASV
jgi:hypothetical protein